MVEPSKLLLVLQPTTGTCMKQDKSVHAGTHPSDLLNKSNPEDEQLQKTVSILKRPSLGICTSEVLE